MARPKGSPNKYPKALKEMILGALDKAGGEGYLVKQANDNPSGFLTLIGKVLPLQVTGDKDAPLVVEHTTDLDRAKAIAALLTRARQE
jgi:hypothetical protein